MRAQSLESGIRHLQSWRGAMFGRRTKRTGGPSSPHRFVEPRDSKMGLAVAGMQPALQQAPVLAGTDAMSREAKCAMQGCSLPRDHPIHDA